MLRNSPQDNEPGKLQVDFELIETEPAARQSQTALAGAPRHWGRAASTRRRVSAGLLVCACLAAATALTHAWDLHTQHQRQLSTVAAHVEIYNPSNQSRAIGGTTDDEIPFVVFNDGASAFTLLTITVNEPDLVLPNRLPAPVQIPPGAQASAPLRFTEQCAKRPNAAEPSQVELTVRNAYGNQWTTTARLIDPLNALSAARSLCTSPLTLAASLPNLASSSLTPAVHGRRFTLQMLITNPNPQTAYVSSQPASTRPQGFEASTPLTQIPSNASREIPVTINVTDCNLALHSSQIIDAPPVITVDIHGARQNGAVVFAPADGQTLQLAIAGALLKACGN